MSFIDNQLVIFKNMIEQSILTGGAKGKESMIRSSALINLIHDAVKYELQQQGLAPANIYPHFHQTKPEIKLAGFLKQKDQDVCVIPSNIPKAPLTINWGPMAFQNKRDLYGHEYSTNTLVINVRSQMSSLAKNADTLFERTFAEALNLHMRYPEMVLGEVYLIPTHEYHMSMMMRKLLIIVLRLSVIKLILKSISASSTPLTTGLSEINRICTKGVRVWLSISMQRNRDFSVIVQILRLPDSSLKVFKLSMQPWDLILLRKTFCVFTGRDIILTT